MGTRLGTGNLQLYNTINNPPSLSLYVFDQTYV